MLIHKTNIDLLEELFLYFILQLKGIKIGKISKKWEKRIEVTMARSHTWNQKNEVWRTNEDTPSIRQDKSHNSNLDIKKTKKMRINLHVQGESKSSFKKYLIPYKDKFAQEFLEINGIVPTFYHNVINLKRDAMCVI